MPEASPPPVDLERLNHYREFYLETPQEGRLIVLGNCQAESIRLALDGPDIETMRVPPVHELTVDEMPALHAHLAVASVVISQPIRRGYRGLAVSTDEVASAIRSTARMLLVPPIRHQAVHPDQFVFHAESPSFSEAPIVPYQRFTNLASALGLSRTSIAPARVKIMAAASSDGLRRREIASGAIQVSDLFDSPSFGLMRTFNHPANPIWEQLASRIRDRLGLAAPEGHLSRQLLSSVIAPRDQIVFEAWDLAESPSTTWRIDGEIVENAAIDEAQLRWYRAHPEVVAALAGRFAEMLDLLFA